MFLRCNSKAVILAIACFLLLLTLFSGSIVQADGGGTGSWPQDPPNGAPKMGEDGTIDGVDVLTAVMTMMELIIF